MRRIAVFGLPGTGKTTFAVRLARMLDIEHHDLDRVLFTRGGALPLEEFRTHARAITEGEAWIVDGNYSKLRDIVWHRADVVVWLDYGLPLIVWRVSRRNVLRPVGREATPTGAFSWRRAFFSRRSVLANTVRKWVRNRGKYARYASETAELGVRVVRFRTPGEAARWLTSLGDEPH